MFGPCFIICRHIAERERGRERERERERGRDGCFTLIVFFAVLWLLEFPISPPLCRGIVCSVRL